MANVEQLSAVAGGGFGEGRDIGDFDMQTAGDVHAQLQRADQFLDPALGHHATPIGDPEDDRFDPGFRRLLNAHIRNPEIGSAFGKTELTKAPFGSPYLDTVGRFGRQLVDRVAQEHQIGIRDFHVSHLLLTPPPGRRPID